MQIEAIGDHCVGYKRREVSFVSIRLGNHRDHIYMLTAYMVGNFERIRECGSTLYVNFQFTFLLTRLQEALYEDLSA